MNEKLKVNIGNVYR